MTITEPTITAWLQALDGGLRHEADVLFAELTEAMESVIELVPRLKAFAERVETAEASARADVTAAIGEERERSIDDGLMALTRAMTGFDAIWERMSAYSDAIHPEIVLGDGQRVIL